MNKIIAQVSPPSNFDFTVVTIVSIQNGRRTYVRTAMIATQPLVDYYHCADDTDRQLIAYNTVPAIADYLARALPWGRPVSF